MGRPVPFNEEFLQRGEERTLSRLAAGEPEAFLIWSAATHPKSDEKAAALVSLTSAE